MTSSTGRPSNPPLALTSSRQISSAVLITLLGAAPNATNELQPKNFTHLAHGCSLCWHPVPPLWNNQRSGPESASTRHPGRDHLGMVGDIISEWRARSSRNGGRHHLGISTPRRVLIKSAFL